MKMRDINVQETGAVEGGAYCYGVVAKLDDFSLCIGLVVL